MDYSLTSFNSIFDNKTDQRFNFSSFEQFEALLYMLSNDEKESKRDAKLISPAIYKEGATRANANVIEWSGWAAIDVDDHEFKGNLEQELKERYGNWYYVCYSTASSRKDYPKFRMVFPLKASVKASKIKHFWFALNTEFDAIGDRQTKDLSRMYYIPGKYKDAYNFIFTNKEGNYIDPDALMSRHPYVEKTGKSFFDRLPDEMQEKIIEHRKSKMSNTKVSWSGYRDCPFVSKKLVEEYKSINETGWYHTMYRIMVSIAANAVRREYPITASEIAMLCREIDLETGNWYQGRPLDVEADRAIEFVYKNM